MVPMTVLHAHVGEQLIATDFLVVSSFFCDQGSNRVIFSINIDDKEKIGMPWNERTADIRTIEKRGNWPETEGSITQTGVKIVEARPGTWEIQDKDAAQIFMKQLALADKALFIHMAFEEEYALLLPFTVATNPQKLNGLVDQCS